MKSRRILLVDDEEDIINLVRLILEDAGYEVVTCVNGADALQRVEKEAFDLVLLDIMMPMISGWEVLRELRSRSQTKDLPVALLTARATPDVDQPKPSDYADYIIKPFEPEDLLNRIQQILANQPPGH